MAIVRANQLEAGMILEQDVKDRSGRVLLRRGVSLTEKTLRILKTWGIAEVDIKAVGDASADKEEGGTKTPVDPATLAKAEKEAAEIFKCTDLKNPVMKELFHICSLRIAHAKSG